jgi:predicted esterase/catechol 2,3-dioxygenase-like lactoylglutathione lyase family enzyme
MSPNKDTLAVSGIHHITAVAASAAENFNFYTRILGLRLVKKTVNFDDPTTYHLYYGDQAGHPGTILTFFPWERLPQGKPGAGMITAIAFAVPRSTMTGWQRHLESNRIHVDQTMRFGEPVLRFNDPHGLPLELVGIESISPSDAPAMTTGLPSAIAGFHSATMLLNQIDATEAVLNDAMGMVLEKRSGNRYRFGMYDHQAPGHLLDVVVDPSIPAGRSGGGTVHHIAFRTRDRREQQKWQTRLRQGGLSVSDVRDRNYFESIYFHEPGGVLFEIATDPPGFAVDEDQRQLGSTLKLPAQLESMRSRIEAQLPPLEAPDFKHVYFPSQPGSDPGDAVVALHGTGGDEHDLIPLVRQISPTAPIISPRGQVSENGMPRFFKRLANGVFDPQEVTRRAHELADFLSQSGQRYQPQNGGLMALGYSNGANIAAAILLLRPEIFSRAILLRPMLPLTVTDIPDLGDLPVFVARGKHDTIIPGDSTDRLVKVLEEAGAQVTVVRIDAGHEITSRDIAEAQSWLNAHQSAPDRIASPTYRVA